MNPFFKVLLIPILFLLQCNSSEIKYDFTKNVNINGITVVAPPVAFKGDPMKEVKSTTANWIALVPYGFHRMDETTVRYNLDRQWWGEKKEGVEKSIELAHQNGLKIMLKPQVYIPGGWVGNFDLQTEEEWQKWEQSYEEFIMFYVDLAIANDVNMICIATEYRMAVQQREPFWRKLIRNIRTKYKGKLVYSSNWDSYEKVPFWDALDYIGVSSYFPLDESPTPKKENLIKAWKPIVKKLKNYSSKHGKKMLFTEYGYLTIDGCAGKTWELEKRVKNTPINQEAQSIALDALYSVFWEEEFWAGGFLWKWFPEGMGHEGYKERDYTPQNKKSQQTIKSWFSK